MRPDPVAVDVRVAAQAAPDWARLTGAMRGCTACPELAATRTQVVVDDAPAGARLLLMGEAPGATEDETGRPFVGRSGQLLDRLLADVGLDRSRVAVLNTAKCRPPGNRPPTRLESGRCRGWTERQLDLLQPSVVVPLGLSATRWVLGPTTLTAARGRVHQVGGRQVLPTYHPSAALRWGPNGEPERLLRQDLATAAAL
ncbi:MAG: uracil-DNA glycosylase [Actinobacteria bacterium]|nr:uracil-DNA glycosylase [Actinomycetota bacterium]MCA1721272.1 uracil-DNA glycosylase [Actinomycetota bacterium]